MSTEFDNLFKKKLFTTVSKKFCNILIHANLQYIYHMTKAV